MAIPHFERLANASTRAYGGKNAKIVIIDEHADTMQPESQAAEADRVSKLLFGKAP